MGKSSTLKDIFIPALISLTAFLTLTYLLLPLYRRTRNTYAQYIPHDLHNRFTDQTSGIRSRVSERIARWREGRDSQGDIHAAGEELLDGEELMGVDDDVRRRIEREAARRNGTGYRQDGGRLSRDLEEGFMDDSESESENGNGRTRR